MAAVCAGWKRAVLLEGVQPRALSGVGSGIPNLVLRMSDRQAASGGKMTLEFEWDPAKAEINLQKHEVSYEEASTIFDDPLFITFLDEEHSIGEERYITMGLSRRQHLLLVAHTDRKGRIRIISARKATKNERRFYEEEL